MEKFQDYVAGKKEILLVYLNYTFNNSLIIKSNLKNINTVYHVKIFWHID